MRVLVIDHTAQEGGAELALARVAARLRAGGVDIRAVVFEEGALVQRLRADGIRTIVLPLDPSLNTTSREGALSPRVALRALLRTLSFVPRLARAIRGAEVDLVVANTLKAAVFTSLAAPLAGRRWVWHLHDRLARDYLPGPLVVAMRALAAVGPRRVVVNSEATRQTLPRSVRTRAVVAYPGLPESAFAPRTAAPRRPVVGIIGRISPTKGQKEFLAAAARVSRSHPEVRFRVVGAALFGETAYEEEVRALPSTWGIDDRVEFTGWVADPGAQLRALSLLVHASPVPEPFGQVVVEAMAAGVPVVAAAAGGVTEILDPEGEAPGTAVHETPLGILVAPGDIAALSDAIALALTRAPHEQDRLVQVRSAAASRFSIADTARIVRDVWEEASRR